jgi:hypothetical protein
MEHPSQDMKQTSNLTRTRARKLVRKIGAEIKCKKVEREREAQETTEFFPVVSRS